MGIYNKIKREHLFIFVVILVSLILFRSFDFGYDGLAVQNIGETCTQQGYSCCSAEAGQGTNYFSLDNTCSNNQGCWSYCQENSNSNMVSGYFSFSDVYGSVTNFFKNLFKPSVGVLPEEQICEGTPSVSCGYFSYDRNTCSQITGCTWSSNFGGGGCLGSFTCDAQSSKQACYASPGCNTIEPYAICQGTTSLGCSTFDSLPLDERKNSCQETVGCFWSVTNTFCSGFISQCSQQSLNVCSDLDGCYIQGGLQCNIPSCNPDNPRQYCFQSGDFSSYIDCPTGQVCSAPGYCVDEFPDSTPPASTLLSPLNGADFAQNTQISFQCGAQDNVGLSKIELWITGPGIPFSAVDSKVVSGLGNGALFTKSFVMAGNYGWNCRAYDLKNNYADAPQTFGFKISGDQIVQDTTKPTSNLIYPTSNAEYVINSQVPFTCSATDNTGLSKIELWITGPGFNGYTKVDEKAVSGLSAQSSFTRSFTSTGNYAYNCRAYDTSNNYADSSQGVLFKVISNQVCTPGSIKTGTQCLVCNVQGSSYSQDNTKCANNQICDVNGQCINSGVQDTVKPTVTLVSPIDNVDNFVEFIPNSQIAFTCSATDNNALSKVELWITGPGIPFSAVDSKSLSGTSSSATFTKSYNTIGSYAWNCKFFDTAGNSAFGNINGQSAGFKIQGGSVVNEICDNNIDDDSDGAIDALDTGCASGAYVKLESILPTYFGKTITPAKEPFENSDINLNCKISQFGSTLPRAINCIYANVGSTACELDDSNSDENVNFVCNVGSLGYKNVSCNVLSSCHAYPASSPIKKLNYPINVTEPELCKTIVESSEITVSEINVDDNNYDAGDTITATLTIGNQKTSSVDIVVSMQLYDINKRTLIKGVEQTKKLSADSETDYELKLDIPISLVESKFRLYFKINQKSAENKLCVEDKKDLTIEGSSSSCEDLDDDGYNDELCGGDDCDEGDADINPGADEICTDLIDNDCNGLIDKSDPLCGISQCISGDSRACGKGICKGTQICTSGSWGACAGGQQSINEMCSNSLDDDCDGFTDSSDSDCGVSGDSDNDGLPDSWESSNFGSTFLYDGGDDPDDDGKTNLEEYELGTDPNKSDKGTSLFTTVLIVMGVIVVALFAVWFFALRPKKPKFNYQPSKPNIQQTSIKKPFFHQKEEVNPVLRDYIKNSLRKSYTKEQIKKALLMKGWKEHEIEQAFKK